MNRSLWNYYRDQPSNPLSSNSESFKYKTSITGNIYKLVAGEAGYKADKVGKNETEIVVPLKHLSSFWRTLKETRSSYFYVTPKNHQFIFFS